MASDKLVAEQLAKEEERRKDDESFKEEVRTFMAHTTGNFSQIFKDREHDHKLSEDIYRAVTGAKTEVELLNANVGEATEKVKEAEKEVKKDVTKAVTQIKKELGLKAVVRLIPRTKSLPGDRRWWDLLGKLKDTLYKTKKIE